MKIRNNREDCTPYMNLPDGFKVKMKELLRDEYEDFVASYSQKPGQGIRINLLKTGSHEFEETLTQIPWCPEGFYIDRDSRPGKSPLYHAGLYYIQEPSAMAPVSAFDIAPGHKVLDLCAAPGGKSVHAAGKLNGQGLLISNDVSASRAKALVKNIEIAGITNAVVLNETPERLSEKFIGFFDRIIVDAPCSGEGMFRKDPDAVKSWAEHTSPYCTGLQREILRYAAKMLAPGGKIMYSTCTFAPEENELMILEFLKKNPGFEPVRINTAALGISTGFSVGNCYKEDADTGSVCECFGRIWPHKHRGEGHFLACVKKRFNDTIHGHNCDNKLFDINPCTYPVVKDINYFYEFCKEYLNFTPHGNFTQYGSTLFLQPEGLPSLERIRVAMGGFRLGDIKTKRFEPSQAFAMSLKRGDARNSINFSDKSSEIIRYLKGESFDTDAPDGWCLVCVNGFPVGWGKVSGSRMKNKYNRSWLMA